MYFYCQECGVGWDSGSSNFLNATGKWRTRGGMCPLCICPLVMCCLAWGMEPIWKLSGPPAPERMMAGRATEPVSTFPIRLNCCCRRVDLKSREHIFHSLLLRQALLSVRASLVLDQLRFVINLRFHLVSKHRLCNELKHRFQRGNTHTNSPFGGDGVLEHGRLFVSLQAKVIFTLFL